MVMQYVDGADAPEVEDLNATQYLARWKAGRPVWTVTISGHCSACVNPELEHDAQMVMITMLRELVAHRDEYEEGLRLSLDKGVDSPEVQARSEAMAARLFLCAMPKAMIFLALPTAARERLILHLSALMQGLHKELITTLPAPLRVVLQKKTIH